MIKYDPLWRTLKEKGISQYQLIKDYGIDKAQLQNRVGAVLDEQLMEQMRADGLTDLLMMGAGPWKHASCMSAYCVDAQRMADAVHMKCWADDGKIRYFSLILFQSA